MAVFNLVEDVVPVIHFDHFLDHVFIRVDSSEWSIFADRFQIARFELPLIELLDVGAAEAGKCPVTKLDPSIVVAEKKNRMIIDADVVGDVVDQNRFSR